MVTGVALLFSKVNATPGMTLFTTLSFWWIGMPFNENTASLPWLVSVIRLVAAPVGSSTSFRVVAPVVSALMER